MKQKKYYPVTLYMNEEFVENYFESFLILARVDKRFELPEKSEDRTMAVCLRALIKSYVDYYKKKSAGEKKSADSNIHPS